MKKHPLLIATRNPGKILEIEQILSLLFQQAGFQAHEFPFTLLHLEQAGISFTVEESETTYMGNALKKACEYGRAAGLMTLADDSGLEVDALQGAPGLYSARYSPQPGATDADRRNRLLENVSLFPTPWTARFQCAIAIAVPSSSLAPYSLLAASGTCEGIIITPERGKNGFGYDPIFQLTESSKTMAELEVSEKNRLSHRALAMQAIFPSLLEQLQRLPNARL